MSMTNKTSAMLRVALGASLLFSVAWRASPAQAQTCLKYTNGVAFCSSTGGQLADPAWCNPLDPDNLLLPLSPQNETILYSRLYADTPEEAMDEWGKYGFPEKYANQAEEGELMWQFTENPNDEEAINVWFDFNNNDLPDDQGTILYFEPSLTREPCCEIVVKGPHELMPDVWYDQPGGKYTPVVQRAPADGLPFTSWPLFEMMGGTAVRSQVWQIRRPNQLKNERFRFASDLFRPEAKELRKFETELLGEAFEGALDNEPFDGERGDDAPEVDHIIPRVDKYGCPCGSNSSRNAHIISAKLNRELSNNCSDPRRIAIIKHYAVAPGPPVLEAQPMQLTDWASRIGLSLRRLTDRVHELLWGVFNG
jgi:hypothetical protein